MSSMSCFIVAVEAEAPDRSWPKLQVAIRMKAAIHRGFTVPHLVWRDAPHIGQAGQSGGLLANHIAIPGRWRINFLPVPMRHSFAPKPLRCTASRNVASFS